jgi:kumamolisin
MNARPLALALVVAAAGWGASLVPAAPARGDARNGPTPPGARVDFDLVLHTRREALDRYLAAVADPRSALYGRYLTPAETGRRFGLSTGSLAALGRRLRSEGLHVTGRTAARTSLRVHGTAKLVNRLFGFRLQDFTGVGGRYHRPDRAPAVPRSLARWVDDVAGLDEAPVVRTDAAARTIQPFEPNDSKMFYDVGPLHQRKIDGRGMTIALLSIDQFNGSNIKAHAARYKLAVKPVTKRKVGFGSRDTSSLESDMDIEIIRSVAPGAQIVNYQLGSSVPEIADAIDQVVSERKATIVSASFGLCDGTNEDDSYVSGPHALLRLNAGERKRVKDALATAAAAGITFFFSTGDLGGHDCQRAAPKDPLLSAHFPADAPYTVAVGGTVAFPSGKGLGEGAWGDSLSNSGGGGGLNPFDEQPPWQNDVRAAGSNGKRQLPDVSALAGSPYWSIYSTFSDGSRGWGGGGGTSAATPFWAGAMALVQQYMTQKHAGPVCFAAPFLYALAKGTWRAKPFFDITTGTNLGWPAARGWDFATGWGSPDVWNLAQDAVAYRAKHPLPGGGSPCRL